MSTVSESASLSEARKIMVDRHVRPADVTRLDVIDAFLDTRREVFFPKAKRPVAYACETIQVAENRYELDPRVFAKMLQALEPEASDLALVVGSGGGYAAAVTSRLVSTVVALECDAELAAASEAALVKTEADAAIMARGPLEAGWGEHQPYNIILVYGGVVGEPPSTLTDQLADGGRIAAIAMDGPIGRCVVGVKASGSVGYRPAFDAAAPILPGLDRPRGFEF